MNSNKTKLQLKKLKKLAEKHNRRMEKLYKRNIENTQDGGIFRALVNRVYEGTHTPRGRRLAREQRGRGKNNKWIAHVKAYAKKHNISYREALVKSKKTYKK